MAEMARIREETQREFLRHQAAFAARIRYRVERTLLFLSIAISGTAVGVALWWLTDAETTASQIFLGISIIVGAGTIVIAPLTVLAQRAAKYEEVPPLIVQPLAPPTPVPVEPAAPPPAQRATRPEM